MMAALSSRSERLTRFGKTIQDLHDETTWLPGCRSNRAANRGRDLLKRKNRHALSLVIELELSWYFPLSSLDELGDRKRSNWTDRHFSSNRLSRPANIAEFSPQS